ncbi:hypothetical protein SADUNF_Sadunf05G0193800 [Salix dunnii]|uniref:DUF3456 domain-containing protein n=1 Tax=Salix dunnii TaxID=1413687 RepID=A0A835N2H2_9ROSI|nr:hypothetical protein SADUNF_Sadunf05G0193800 [Salix dunnii]
MHIDPTIMTWKLVKNDGPPGLAFLDHMDGLSSRFPSNSLDSPVHKKQETGVRGEIGETKTRAIKMAESTAWLLMIFVVLTFTVVSSIDDKCAACNAVAEEIENGLSKEKPRNHLDMRHRLDSTGQRKGKVIDYRVSELRVVELLDGLCDKMQDYTLQKVDSKRYEWIRVDSWDNLTIREWDWNSTKFLILAFLGIGITAFPTNWLMHISCDANDKQEAKAYSKDISSYCGRLLEETEDELAERIKKGSVKAGGVSKILCQDLSKHCNMSSDSHQADADDDEPDEL